MKADSAQKCSQVVPHPSTNWALRRLTSEVRRDPVHSTRYGRQQFEYLHCMTLAKNLAKSNSTGVGVRPGSPEGAVGFHVLMTCPAVKAALDNNNKSSSSRRRRVV